MADTAAAGQQFFVAASSTAGGRRDDTPKGGEQGVIVSRPNILTTRRTFPVIPAARTVVST